MSYRTVWRTVPTITDHDNHMHMVWHDNIFVYLHCWSRWCYILNRLITILSQLIQYHLTIHHLTKIMLTILCAYRHKISSWWCVVIPLSTWTFALRKWYHIHLQSTKKPINLSFHSIIFLGSCKDLFEFFGSVKSCDIVEEILAKLSQTLMGSSSVDKVRYVFCECV